MKNYYNPNAPMLGNDSTFRGEIAVEDMTQWCQANCNGTWELVTVDHVRFEMPVDADAFELYFWTKSVRFNI